MWKASLDPRARDEEEEAVRADEVVVEVAVEVEEDEMDKKSKCVRAQSVAATCIHTRSEVK